MQLSDFDYNLPEELIAQRPLPERDQSRLLVVDRAGQKVQHRSFGEIIEYLRDDDLLVMNDTRVSAVRLRGFKSTGGSVEALVMRRIEPGLWHAMVKPGRRVHVGARLEFEKGLAAEVIDRTEDGGRLLRFSATDDPDEVIARIGEVPLPPYIHEELGDKNRYQTIYAAADGSAAAPTAGLHFTKDLLDRIKARGIQIAFVTLHVGIATFRPVRTENLDEHDMHLEAFEISPQCAQMINSAPGRIICVGTTSVRALESAAVGKRRVSPTKADTKLFIRPGYEFQVIDGLITNFHIPKSTLLMLVSAFGGIELVRRAYADAVQMKYRFFSFGDAMLLY